MEQNLLNGIRFKKAADNDGNCVIIQRTILNIV